MTDTDSHRHGCKAVSRLQVFRPVRLDFRRAAHSQVKVAVLISNFIMPGTAVIDLENRLASAALFPIYPIGIYSFADQLPVFVISIVFDVL